jgi:hypothetical protein
LQTAPAVVVCRRSRHPLRIVFSIPKHGSRRFRLELTLEDGTKSERELAGYGVRFLGDRWVDGSPWAQLEYSLDALPLGYHTLRLYGLGETHGAERDHDACELLSTTSIIIAPDRCFLPQDLEHGARLWGVSAQLYALRGAGTLGIGDTGSLMELIRFTSARGIRFLPARGPI